MWMEPYPGKRLDSLAELITFIEPYVQIIALLIGMATLFGTAWKAASYAKGLSLSQERMVDIAEKLTTNQELQKEEMAEMKGVVKILASLYINGENATPSRTPQQQTPTPQ